MAPADGTGYIKGEPIKRQRVAIVGSGLAGLTIAYLLNRDNFDVEIFEIDTKPSLDAASMSITYSSNGKLATERVDVPMRAFAGGYYASLLAMYKYLEIPFRSQRFLFLFSATEYTETPKYTTTGSESEDNCGMSRFSNGDETPYFIHSSNNHRFPPVKPEGRTWFEYLTEVLYLWFVYTYFTICCFWLPPEAKTFTEAVGGEVSVPTGRTESLREYHKRIHLPEYFVKNYLLPLMSSVTTCPHETLLDFPAIDVTCYKKFMHKQPHYMVETGVSQIQKKLLEGVKIGMQRRVLSVESLCNGEKGTGPILLRWEELSTGVLHEQEYDQVVLAVSPHCVGNIYKKLSKQMSKIPCCESEVVVHYDEKVIEDVLDHSRVLPAVNDIYAGAEKPYPSAKLGQLLGSCEELIGTTDAQIIQLRTTTHPSNMVFHKSATPWSLLNNGQSLPSLVTESTHIHPPGVLLTTSTIYPLRQDKVLGMSRFVRVLRTPESRDVVEGLFRGKGISMKKGYVDEKSGEGVDDGEEWRNGDEGVWLCGGWCWDGMVLLEGCVRSAVRVARELGVEAPWKVEESWGGN
ncbi:hypothetical protein L211DRAFT_855506 [Terfezia boudieri ATCC MYA-4762]|uniref:FAD/NAD(P)-binding domain-containing protein n=1 Tax=Terfezia boudieri ATCC MYA-4762 TaxID=1051890 RepID=A0A3N4M6N4_9PEZI|nr:hypothetical protein L211DRAFT_855506 [Terfezia boudieri ATCC MYA-4762]